jgi:ferric-dicitrate binding protein FerR (iron transport regulator)
MNEHEHNGYTMQQEQARDMVRELTEVHADPEFRARLEREFMTGNIMEHAPVEVPRRSPMRTFLRWAYIPAAAAALLIAFNFANQGPDWRVIGTSSGGAIRVDGDRIGIQSVDRLESVIHPGATIRVSENAELTLLGPETLVMQATPGTEMTVPNMPGRWFGNTMHARVMQGEARFVTGPGFAGRSLVVDTPEGRVQVTGTIISVLRDEAGGVTCICVMTGEARIGMNSEDMEMIPAGKRKVMFADGREPMVVDILPEHRDGLVPFVERHQRYLED